MNKKPDITVGLVTKIISAFYEGTDPGDIAKWAGLSENEVSRIVSGVYKTDNSPNMDVFISNAAKEARMKKQTTRRTNMTPEMKLELIKSMIRYCGNFGTASTDYFGAVIDMIDIVLVFGTEEKETNDERTA